jgi:hypothetical protein
MCPGIQDMAKEGEVLLHGCKVIKSA